MQPKSSHNAAADYFDIDWGDSPLIPAGEYQAVYISHETTNGSFGPKVKVSFRVVSHGPFYETQIAAWYNIKDGASSKRKGSKIRLARGSKLTSELLKVLQIKKRVDRLSPSMLRGYVLVIKVRIVTTNSRQKKLTEAQQYSIVDSLQCILNLQDISETLNVLPKVIPEPIPTAKGSQISIN